MVGSDTPNQFDSDKLTKNQSNQKPESGGLAKSQTSEGQQPANSDEDQSLSEDFCQGGSAGFKAQCSTCKFHKQVARSYCLEMEKLKSENESLHEELDTINQAHRKLSYLIRDIVEMKGTDV